MLHMYICSALYTVNCTLYIIQYMFTLYTVHYSMYNSTNLKHHGGASPENVEDGPQGNIEAEDGVPVPARLYPRE